VTFAHRNKDLATLQYFICANIRSGRVMLGGTQDNGASAPGPPAWEHLLSEMEPMRQINATTNIRRWFESRWWGFPIFPQRQCRRAGQLGRPEGRDRH